MASDDKGKPGWFGSGDGGYSRDRGDGVINNYDSRGNLESTSRDRGDGVMNTYNGRDGSLESTSRDRGDGVINRYDGRDGSLEGTSRDRGDGVINRYDSHGNTEGTSRDRGDGTFIHYGGSARGGSSGSSGGGRAVAVPSGGGGGYRSGGGSYGGYSRSASSQSSADPDLGDFLVFLFKAAAVITVIAIVVAIVLFIVSLTVFLAMTGLLFVLVAAIMLLTVGYAASAADVCVTIPRKMKRGKLPFLVFLLTGFVAVNLGTALYDVFWMDPFPDLAKLGDRFKASPYLFLFHFGKTWNIYNMPFVRTLWMFSTIALLFGVSFFIEYALGDATLFAKSGIKSKLHKPRKQRA